MFNLSMELRPGYKPHFIMSKTLVLFASIVMFIENSINAEERLIFRHQISATESLLITVIPTNITWQGDVPPLPSHRGQKPTVILRISEGFSTLGENRV